MHTFWRCFPILVRFRPLLGELGHFGAILPPLFRTWPILERIRPSVASSGAIAGSRFLRSRFAFQCRKQFAPPGKDESAASRGARMQIRARWKPPGHPAARSGSSPGSAPSEGPNAAWPSPAPWEICQDFVCGFPQSGFWKTNMAIPGSKDVFLWAQTFVFSTAGAWRTGGKNIHSVAQEVLHGTNRSAPPQVRSGRVRPTSQSWSLRAARCPANLGQTWNASANAGPGYADI